MEYYAQLQRVCQLEAKRFILLVGLIAITHLLLQSLMLPYGNALLSLLPYSETDSWFNLDVMYINVKDNVGLEGQNTSETFGRSSTSVEIGDSMVDNFPPKNGTAREETSVLDLNNQNVIMEQAVLPDNGTLLDGHSELEGNFTSDVSQSYEDSFQSQASLLSREDEVSLQSDDIETANVESNGGSLQNDNAVDVSLAEDAEEERLKNEKDLAIRLVDASLDSSRVKDNGRRKKITTEMPPETVTSIVEMNRIFARHLKSSLSMKPRWSSTPDRQILDAKLKIIKDPASKIDRDLYAPLFRNISQFLRSYELMERTLKVYVYKDGKRPIFHQPVLKGLYASEGWFMKQMEGNRQFVVKDPRRAHLFYMPLSSKMLEHALYVKDSRNRTNLQQYVKQYSEKIASKYPFWNRTGGTDHFLVACHDWAPYETTPHMDNCIKALCNADITIGFKIGRDISLPETLIRFARNPVRYVGGKPASQRNILAFYSGNNHGYLRPILLKHWKDKGDPDMRIYGPLPSGVAKRMNYFQHMKSSRYCICPKGYEVNSPRIVEAIMFECVPVIISDNFIPPFFEVLNWDAFSVIMAEKDVPRLKEILLAIPEKKYLEMQLAVRKVQRHFLWHYKPVKYDLFHMTLHSIWYSRVFQQARAPGW